MGAKDDALKENQNFATSNLHSISARLDAIERSIRDRHQELMLAVTGLANYQALVERIAPHIWYCGRIPVASRASTALPGRILTSPEPLVTAVIVAKEFHGFEKFSHQFILPRDASKIILLRWGK